MKWISRTAIAVVILSMAIAGAWACGDDGGNELTLTEYFQKLDVVDNDGNQRIDALFEGVTDENDVEGVRAAFRQFPTAIAAFRADLDKLDPPDEAQAAHDAALARFKDVEDATKDALDDVNKATTADELNAALESGAFTKANDALTAACLNLQKIADDNKITVTLDCDDEEEE